MAIDKKQYKKLSGNSPLHVQKALVADDHILVINGRYSETFRRLYFKDIQAILVEHNRIGLGIAIGSLVLGLMFLGLLFSSPGEFGFWAYIILLSVCVLVSFYNFFGGGSTVFGVKTAVQTVILHGLNTKRKAHKARAQLVEKIESIQGSLSTEELREAIHNENEERAAKPTVKPVAQVAPPPPPVTSPPPVPPALHDDITNPTQAKDD